MREKFALRRKDFNHQAVCDGQLCGVYIDAIDAFVVRHVGRHADHFNGLRHNFPHFQSVIGTDTKLELEQQFMRIVRHINRRNRPFQKNFSKRCSNAETEPLGKFLDGFTIGGDKLSVRAFRNVLRAFQFRALDQAYQ